MMKHSGAYGLEPLTHRGIPTGWCPLNPFGLVSNSSVLNLRMLWMSGFRLSQQSRLLAGLSTKLTFCQFGEELPKIILTIVPQCRHPRYATYPSVLPRTYHS